MGKHTTIIVLIAGFAACSDPTSLNKGSVQKQRIPVDFNGTWEKDFIKGSKSVLIPSYRYHIPDDIKLSLKTTYVPRQGKTLRTSFVAGQIEMDFGTRKTIFNNFQFDNSWKEPDASIRAFLSQNHEGNTFKDEQILSCTMLDKYLLTLPATTEVLNAKAFYVENLLRNKSEEYDLMTKALDQLTGFWTPEKIKGARGQIVEFVRQESRNLESEEYRFERKIGVRRLDLPQADADRIERKFDQRKEALADFLKVHTGQ